MSLSSTSTSTARCCARILRSSSTPTSSARIALSTRARRTPSSSRRWESTSPAASTTASAKISTIVDQISQLTLLETADLVSNLKTRLNIPDTPFYSAPPPGSPSASPGQAAEEDEAAAPAAQEKTLFTLSLKSFDAGAKPKIIKEIKSMLGLSLVDSKKFVESAPKVMKEGVAKEEAEKIVETLKGLGGVVVME